MFRWFEKVNMVFNPCEVEQKPVGQAPNHFKWFETLKPCDVEQTTFSEYIRWYETIKMVSKQALILILLLSNDVELNPGPMSAERRTERLEKFVNELQRDVRTLRKVVEQMTSQIDSQAVRERPKMAALLEEVNVIKETMSIQVSLIS